MAAFALIVVGCGKKGPPLPPLVKLPVPPADLVAQRRGDTVDLQFTVPSANTDGTKPANVAAVDVYAITLPPIPLGSPPLTDTEILKLATKVDRLDVKAPKDPDQTVEEDESDADVDAPEGKGLDQGSIARAAEELPDDAATPVDPLKGKKKPKKPRVAVDEAPLLPPLPDDVPSRTYFVLGLSARGNKGPLSRRLTVPLVPAPPPPGDVDLTYDETRVIVTWSPSSDPPRYDTPPDGLLPSRPIGDQTRPMRYPDADTEDEEEEPLLPSRPIGYVTPPIGYNVYELPDEFSEDPLVRLAPPVKLTKTPVAEPTFTDTRMTWGEYRCYQVRAVQSVAGIAIESDAPPPICDTLTDTFPPLAPKALQAVPSEGVISLIWEPNVEKDLAGYIVLRGEDEDDLQPITPAPIAAATYKDTVQPGQRYMYEVIAVDKYGNASPPSNRVEEIAR